MKNNILFKKFTAILLVFLFIIAQYSIVIVANQSVINENIDIISPIENISIVDNGIITDEYIIDKDGNNEFLDENILIFDNLPVIAESNSELDEPENPDLDKNNVIGNDTLSPNSSELIDPEMYVNGIVENNSLQLSPPEVDQHALASAYGLTPNASDSTTSAENTNKFIDCINEYGGIIIDDVYYFNTELTTNESIESESLVIKGINNAKMIFGTNQNSISPGHSIRVFVYLSDTLEKVIVDNVSIEGDTGKNVIFFQVPPSSPSLEKPNELTQRTHLNTFRVTNCNFTERISLIRWSNGNTETVFNDIGIDSFLFAYNNLKDINMQFLALQSMPLRNVLIEGNNIENFYSVLFDFGILNSGNAVEATKQRPYAVIRNNTAIMTDDWWSQGSGAYHTMVLFEGVYCIYTGNWVQGLKSSTHHAVYDAYLSASYVKYTNNVWKNICSTTTNSLVTLMKSKGDNASEMKCVRIYENNQFIFEEEFAESLDIDLDKTKVLLYDFPGQIDTFILRNNFIDVYDLFSAGTAAVRHLIFENNNINAKYAYDRTVNNDGYHLIAINDDAERISINNNTIDIKEDVETALGIFRVLKTSGAYIENLDFKGNQIRGPIKYLLGGNWQGTINNLTFTNNVITYTSDTSISVTKARTVDGIFLERTAVNSYIADNMFFHIGKLFESRMRYGSGNKYEEYRMLRTHFSNSSNALTLLDGLINNTNKQKLTRTYTFEDANGTSSFCFEVWFWKDPQTSQVKYEFYDTNDTLRTFNSTGETNGVINVKLHPFGGNATQYIVKYQKNSGVFYITNFANDNSERGYVTIKTVSVAV